jgi:curved DNA-binding protein
LQRFDVALYSTLASCCIQETEVKYHDYYKVLGVERDASDKEIKRAYREQARRYHPDLNTDAGAADQFRTINEAYEVLSDAEKRRHYDSLDSKYRDWQRYGKGSDFDWSGWAQQSRSSSVDYEESSGGMFSDFFRMVFGDGGRKSGASQTSSKQPIAGRDRELDVTITLEEAFRGATRQVKGARSGHFAARIPRGAKNGTRVRFASEGESGFAGGKPGSLFLNITVAEHEVFERSGDDLLMDIEVPLYAAVLGGDVRIPTLSGDVKLKIPPGTQSGKTIRLKDRGMPLLHEEDAYGDLYARVMIQIPEDLTDEEFELFEQLADLRPEF